VRRILRRGAATLSGALLFSTLVPAADLRAENLKLDYQIAWGHVTLAEATIVYKQATPHYRLTSSGRTQGLFDLLFSWEGGAETRGLLREGQRRPLRHENQGVWRDKSRWTRVDWTDPEKPRTETEPPPDPEKVTAVPPEATRGTSDPFTVILGLLDDLVETGRCEAEAKVWDGRRRYDFFVTHLGEDELTADRPWAYTGPAVGCALSYERIGGFWREAPSWREPNDGADARRVVWVAEIVPGRWVPVRAELETRFGAVIGRLKPAEDPDP